MNDATPIREIREHKRVFQLFTSWGNYSHHGGCSRSISCDTNCVLCHTYCHALD